MWPLQECRKEWTDNGKKLKWDEIDEMTGNSNIDSIIDLAHPSLFAPLRMTEAIKSLSSKNSQCIPKNPGDFSRTIINSLAEDISKNILSLKNITGFSFENINIIGGGARNSLLCDTIAEKSKLNVIKGAPEASATGNILLQAIATGVIKNVNEVGSYIKKWT
jgi:sugar (pentulose or hexulose) kinase